MFSLYFQCEPDARRHAIFFGHLTKSSPRWAARRLGWFEPSRKLINAAQRSLFAGIDMMPSGQSGHDYYDEIEHSSGLSEVFSGFSFLRPSVRPLVRSLVRSFVCACYSSRAAGHLSRAAAAAG